MSDADTLEDWKQCAQVEADLRREAHAEIERLRAVIKQEIAWLEARAENFGGHVADILHNQARALTCPTNLF
jgi:hypothetical protein